MSQLDLRRLRALVRKETLQVVRDPSAILIAFVLPIVLLFLFAFAVSLDVRDVKLGVVLETDGPAAQSLAGAFAGTRYFEVTPARNRQELEPAIVAGRLHGMVVIPQDFEQRLASGARGQDRRTTEDDAREKRDERHEVAQQYRADLEDVEQVTLEYDPKAGRHEQLVGDRIEHDAQTRTTEPAREIAVQ